MNPKLVFLHIPKAAGTSFRGMVWNLTETDERFWYGMDSSPQVTEYNESILQGKRFVGGHKGIKFYPPDEKNLYCSLLRDPLERARSLFSYYTRPAGAADDRSFKRRSRQLERWLELGIDPDSIVRSLESCPAFRNEIENHQCAYLSREGRSFEGALETLKTENFLVGESNHLSLLTDQLSDLFEWPELNTIRGNVTRAGGHDGILEEDGAVELIQSLCAEDQKLYEFVTESHNGLYRHVPAVNLFRHHLALNQRPETAEFSRAAWARVKLDAAPQLKIKPRGAVELAVTLHNHSRESLDASLGDGVFFAYKLLDVDGNAFKVNCIRTALLDSVPGGGDYQQNIRVRIPREYFERTRSIRISMLVKGDYWVEQFNPAHTHTVELIKDEQ